MNTNIKVKDFLIKERFGSESEGLKLKEVKRIPTVQGPPKCLYPFPTRIESS